MIETKRLFSPEDLMSVREAADELGAETWYVRDLCRQHPRIALKWGQGSGTVVLVIKSEFRALRGRLHKPKPPDPSEPLTAAREGEAVHVAD